VADNGICNLITEVGQGGVIHGAAVGQKASLDIGGKDGR